MVISFPFTGSLFITGFMAWIPLLFIEEFIYARKKKSSGLLLYSFITFFIYNIGASYWIMYSKGGEVGAALTYVLNGFLMSLVFYSFHLTKKYIGSKQGYIGLVFYWIGFEYIHFIWELSWPWLSLGNIFARVPEIIQWYDITGVLGGTLWLLLVNLIIFKILKNMFLSKESFRVQTPLVFFVLALVIIPFFYSILVYINYKEDQSDTIEVVITQPNVDPYLEKFSGNTYEQLNKFLKIADSLVTDSTAIILAPETAIAESFYEEQFKDSRINFYLVQHLKHWNGPAMLVGASTKRFFEKKNSRASRPFSSGPGFYEFYNSSVLIDTINPPIFVHKSKLVPAVEKLPFSDVFPFLEKLSIDNGGTTGTLGIEDEAKILQTKGFKFAPSICYESVYGGFVADQCRKGAEVIFVLTNDGWWDNSAGHKQHHAIARLRAVETRRYVAQSANTGISTIINQRGEVVHETEYWKPAGIRAKLALNKKPTFYITYGDFLGRSFGFVFLIMMIYTFVQYIRSKLIK